MESWLAWPSEFLQLTYLLLIWPAGLRKALPMKIWKQLSSMYTYQVVLTLCYLLITFPFLTLPCSVLSVPVNFLSTLVFQFSYRYSMRSFDCNSFEETRIAPAAFCTITIIKWKCTSVINVLKVNIEIALEKKYRAVCADLVPIKLMYIL
jgi:hypothetical protein